VGEWVDREILTHCSSWIVTEVGNLDLRGWSGKFSVSTIDGNNIGKIFFLSWYVCHEHPYEIENYSIK